MRPRPALVALLAAALLLGACSDDDPVTAGVGDDPAEQSDPTRTTAAGPPPTFQDDGPNIAPEGAPTAEELEDVMPDPDVLGDRFELGIEPLFDMDESEVASPFCAAGWPGNHLTELWGPADVGGISAGYAYDPEEEGPLVVVRAASFPDAVGHVRDAAAQVETCAANPPDPDEVEPAFEVEPDPGLGDAAIAWGWTSDIQVGSLTSTARLVAVGDVVVFVLAHDSSGVPGLVPADHLDLAALDTFVEQLVDGVATLR